jgi:hypothetical protein
VWYVGQVDQGAIELEDCGNEDVLHGPLRSDRLLREVLSGLGSVALNMAAQRQILSYKVIRADEHNRFHS